jgi:hypothetical protein
MSPKKFIRASMLIFAFAGLTFFVNSCKDDEQSSEDVNETSSISGVVKDTQGNLLSGVTIMLKETDTKRNVEDSTTSADDGSFSFSDVVATAQFLTFEKEGYSTVGITVPSSSLLEGPVTLEAILEFANAQITGRILDAQNDNAPLSGVTVSIGTTSLTTGDDGVFTFENLTIQDYTLTCTKAGLTTITKSLTTDMFDDSGVIDVGDISMGGVELLPGLTLYDLKSADAWYSNEYRGGYSRGGGRIDWSTSFMSCQFFNWVGDWEMQNEGCTLRIVNDEEGQSNPADLVNFDTFTYGRKLITEDNDIMTVYARCHQATTESPVYWGVQVIDLTADDPTVDLIGGVQEHPSSDYLDFTFDLSSYVGKEVAIAIGHFRAQTGDYWNQFCLAHVSFAPSANEGDEYLPGTEISGLEGWNITQEMVRSTMPNTRTHFTGVVPSGLNVQTKSNPAYHDLAGTGHIASEWAFQYVNKDIEPLVSEGIVIKTRSGVDADYAIPESFWYSKFSIASGSDQMTLKVRNFDDTYPTTVKFTVIENDGTTVHFLDPSEYTAVSAGKVDDGNGCWEFINNAGTTGTPDEYATFTYDLSEFDGEDVMICIGVHKGAIPDKSGEQKLGIYSIDLL